MNFYIWWYVLLIYTIKRESYSWYMKKNQFILINSAKELFHTISLASDVLIPV